MTTWDPARTNDLTLSAGNLSAETATGSVQANTRATTGKTTGKWGFEVYFDVVQDPADVGYGFVSQDYTQNNTTWLGGDNNGVGMWANSECWIGTNKPLGDLTSCAYSTGKRGQGVIDLTAKRAWFRTLTLSGTWSAGTWNNNGSANPATGVGGVDLSAMLPSAKTVYPALIVSDYTASAPINKHTGNFGTPTIAYPSGYSQLDAAGATGVMYVKVSGVWKPLVTPSVRVSGVWKPATGVWVRQAGTWMKVFG